MNQNPGSNLITAWVNPVRNGFYGLVMEIIAHKLYIISHIIMLILALQIAINSY